MYHLLGNKDDHAKGKVQNLSTNIKKKEKSYTSNLTTHLEAP